MVAPRQSGSPRPWSTAFLGIGSNMGDRLGHLRRAVFGLATHPQIQVESFSGVFETEYDGEGRQEPYLNACVKVRTALPPQVLLSVLKSVEQRHGRLPGGHMQPRTLDLDILLFDGRQLHGQSLTVPHPRLRQRAFVLEPLNQIAPAEKFPDSGETVGSACAKIRQKSGPWLRECREFSLLPEATAASKEDWRAALAVHCR
jgi:2-amino-4-hydroxy-6-hydroxymethyldihydropteridine diphosphokinase